MRASITPPIARRRLMSLAITALAVVAVSAVAVSPVAATGTRLALSAGAPDISGTRVVWNQTVTSTSGVKYYIYSRNLATGASAVLTDGTRQAGVPRIQGDRVVFSEFQFATPVSMSLVFGESLASGWFFAAPNTGAFAPDVYGDWVTYVSSSDYVYLVDTSQNPDAEWTLSAGTHVYGNYGIAPAALTSKYVYWGDNRVNGNADILYLKLGTNIWSNVDPTEPADNQYDPAGDGEWSVWTDDRNGTEDIYGWNMATGTGRPIAAYTGTQRQADISGPLVVWTDFRTGNGDIYLHDLVTLQTKRLTADTTKQTSPAISGTRVVWEEKTSLGNAVYYLPIAGRQVTAAAPTSVKKGRTAKVAGVASGYAGMPFGSKTITLQRSYDKKTWTSMKTAKTVSSGAYSVYTPSLTRNAYWRVRMIGSGVTLYSPSRLVKVY